MTRTPDPSLKGTRDGVDTDRATTLSGPYGSLLQDSGPSGHRENMVCLSRGSVPSSSFGRRRKGHERWGADTRVRKSSVWGCSGLPPYAHSHLPRERLPVPEGRHGALGSPLTGGALYPGTRLASILVSDK